MSRISTHDYIALSSCVYNHGFVPEGYTLLEYCDEAGFYGAAYSWFDTNEIVIAFRGTEFTDFSDIEADITILLQMAVDQTRYAYSLYQHVKRNYPNATISLTGHSLGGALAQLVAVQVARDEGVGIYAETFNAPGMSGSALFYWKDFQQFSQYEVVNYYNSYDLIGKYGTHIGTVVEIQPEELYRKKMREGGLRSNEDPSEYLRKLYIEPGAHFIKFFQDYFNVEENSCKQIDSTIYRVTDIVSQEEVWSYDNNLPSSEEYRINEVYSLTSDDIIPALNIDVLEIHPEKEVEMPQAKQKEFYGNNKSISSQKEIFIGFSNIVDRLQQQDEKFTFQQEKFYENYDERFKSLSKDVDTITKGMYSQSDSLMLQMSKNLLNGFSNQGQDGKEASAIVSLQSNNGLQNNDFVPPYRSKDDSSQFSQQNGVTARPATVNIVNNLGVTLSAVSNTKWNGRQYVVEVALSEQ